MAEVELAPEDTSAGELFVASKAQEVQGFIRFIAGLKRVGYNPAIVVSGATRDSLIGWTGYALRFYAEVWPTISGQKLPNADWASLGDAGWDEIEAALFGGEGVPDIEHASHQELFVIGTEGTGWQLRVSAEIE